MPRPPLVSPWEYTFSAVVAILMNCGWIIVLVGFWRWIVERTKTINLGQALATRDAAHQQALLDAYDDPDPPKLGASKRPLRQATASGSTGSKLFLARPKRTGFYPCLEKKYDKAHRNLSKPKKSREGAR